MPDRLLIGGSNSCLDGTIASDSCRECVFVRSEDVLLAYAKVDLAICPNYILNKQHPSVPLYFRLITCANDKAHRILVGLVVSDPEVKHRKTKMLEVEL